VEQKTIQILEQQRQDLVIRVLKKHEEMEATRFFTDRILAGIAEFFLLLDKDFQVIQTNGEFIDRTGYPPLNEQPLTLEQLFDAEKSAEIRRVLQSEEVAEMVRRIVQGKMDDGQLKRVEAVICGMTPGERAKPEVINASRRRRIAAGSGVPVSEVNDLLDRFDMMRKMMGQFSKMGGKGGGMPAPGSMPQRPAMHPNPMALKLQQFGRRRR
jgi:signal recognition particle GTPase